MADKKDAKRGTKIEGAEASQLDPAKMGVLVSKSTDPEVEGQAFSGGRGYLQCPWCDAIARTSGEADRNYYTCDNCGNLFR